MAQSLTISSYAIVESFRARIGDVVSPYRIKGAVALSYLNDAIRAIMAVNQDAVNDDAILPAEVSPITTLSDNATDYDIPLKPQLFEAIVLYMLKTQAAKDGGGNVAKYEEDFMRAIQTWGRG